MANLFEWDDAKYSVKIKTIDNQHKKLVDLINQLFNAMVNEEAHSKLSEVLNELIQYTASHLKQKKFFLRNMVIAMQKNILLNIRYL